MDTVNQRGLLARPYGDEDDDGVFEAKDINGAHEMAMNGVVSLVSRHGNGVGGGGGFHTTRTSELTIAFEGEVYIFPAVASEKVQAVLLLLGVHDASINVPSSAFLQEEKLKVVVDSSRGLEFSQRIASLLRFREKRKERCFEKKIHYTCRKEVAQSSDNQSEFFISHIMLSSCCTRCRGSIARFFSLQEFAANSHPFPIQGEYSSVNLDDEGEIMSPFVLNIREELSKAYFTLQVSLSTCIRTCSKHCKSLPMLLGQTLRFLHILMST
ncbi:GATA transcription factor 17-like isoform X2 [Durio zibethinus]|uniref:GATA transcription factor 17-like isoform X2 n=1 Tax=Durio zibethinus TaxID=66656 RepID=A0A6P5XFM7_DURZI|nr:GATA transcription factor 17-like isoform X2 [Durio zibethinus]